MLIYKTLTHIRKNEKLGGGTFQGFHVEGFGRKHHGLL